MFILVCALPIVLIAATIKAFTISMSLFGLMLFLLFASVVGWVKCLDFYKMLKDATVYDAYEEELIVLTKIDDEVYSKEIEFKDNASGSTNEGIKIVGKFENGMLYEGEFQRGKEVTYFNFFTGDEAPTLTIAKERLNVLPKLGRVLFGRKLTERTVYDFTYPKIRVDEVSNLI